MAHLNTLLNLFRESPLRPIQTHMETVYRCSQKLPPFISATIQENWPAAENYYNEINKLENKADDLKKEIRLNLPNNLFLPVPRYDLLELLSVQENIANLTKDIAGIILGRKMYIPDSISDDFQSYLAKSLVAISHANKAVNTLDGLLASGFKGQEVTFVHNIINQLNQAERETDTLQICLRRSLFSLENELPPIEVIFLYELIEQTGGLADCAQNVGYRLQILLAK